MKAANKIAVADASRRVSLMDGPGIPKNVFHVCSHHSAKYATHLPDMAPKTINSWKATEPLVMHDSKVLLCKWFVG